MKKRWINIFWFLICTSAPFLLFGQGLQLIDSNCSETITKTDFEDYLETQGVGVVELTRCPDSNTPNLSVIWSFSNFTKDPRDSLIFYDGLDLSAPRIGSVQELAGNEKDFQVKASLSNASGCLTLLYQPNANSSISEDWELLVSCGTPCQDFQIKANLLDSTQYQLEDRLLTLCPDQPFTLAPTFEFPYNDTFYNQSSSSIQTFWSVNGTPIRSFTLDTSFSDSKGYTITLLGIDSNNCAAQSLNNWYVRVSGPPTFMMGDSIPQEICVGEALSLEAQSGLPPSEDVVTAEPNTFPFEFLNKVSDTIRLPDGKGSQYVSYLRIDEFAEDAVINNGNSIESICINIEHSYLYDLVFELKCPSGKGVILQESNNLNQVEHYLGNPFDDENDPTRPGEGYDYCWVPNTNLPNWNMVTQNMGNNSTLLAGNYAPIESLDSLQDCKINGLWELIITDQNIDDNGFLFEWSISFSDELPSKTAKYTPSVTTLEWQNDFISQQGIFSNTFNTPGREILRLIAEDEYGCSFDTAIVLQVLSTSSPKCTNCNLLPIPDTIGYCGPDTLATFFSRRKDTLTQQIYDQDYYSAFSTMLSRKIDSIELSPYAQGIQEICFDSLFIQAGPGFKLILESPSGQTFNLIVWDKSDTLFLSGICFDPLSSLSFPNDTNVVSGNFRPLEDWSGVSETGNWKLIIDSGEDFFSRGYLSSWSATVNEDYDITYQWLPSSLFNALSCADCPNPEVFTPELTGIQNTFNLLAFDNLGCQDSTTLTIDSLPTALLIDTMNIGIRRVLVNWTDFGPYTYKINVSINGNSQGDNIININEYLLQNITPGTVYHIEVSLEGAPCENIIGILDLTIPCYLEAEIADIKAPTCVDSNNGSARIITRYATNPTFEFIGFGNPFKEPELDSLAPGPYRIVAAEANCKDTVNFDIPTKAPIEATFSSIGENLCYGDRLGGIKALATGGNGGYAFNWTNQGLQQDSLVNLPQGDYPLQIIDTLGCVLDTTAAITAPDSLQYSALITPPSCYGGQDGKIQLDKILGGTAPFQVNWDQGLSNSDKLEMVASGNYCVTVTDSNGCSLTKCFEVIDPDPITIDSFVVVEPKCFGKSDGSIEAYVSGGVGTIEYVWSDPNMQERPKATQLPAGYYILMATDVFGCLTVDSVEMGQPDSFYIEYLAESVTCYGDTDGNIDVTGKGGKTPYSFDWSNNKTGHFIDSLAAGVYRVTATDGGNCTLAQNVEIPGPLLPLGATFNQTQIGCFGAKDNAVEVMGTGGMGGYQYIWEDAREGSVIAQLDTLSYEVYITDASGCRDTFAFQPEDHPSITPNIITNNPTCVGNEDGKIAAIPVDEDPMITNYQFLWNTGDQTPFIENLVGGQDYTLTITYVPTGCRDTVTKFLNPATDITFKINTSAVSCFGGNDGKATIEDLKSQDTNFVFQWDFKTGYQSSNQAVGLKAGSYEVSIENGEGCNKIAQVEITSPEAISISESSVNNLCYGDTLGSIATTINGGIAPYSVVWSTGDTVGVLGKLSSGLYSILVTDANGCTEKGDYEITQPNPLELEAETQAVVCFGEENGTIDIFPFGGTAPFTYSLDGINFTTSSTFSGLPSGGYTAWIQDNNGCKSNSGATIGSPPKLILDIGPSSLSFVLGDSALLKASIINGTPPYNIMWNSSEAGILSCLDCLEPIAMPSQLTFIDAFLTDANGCSASDKMTLVVDKNRVVEVPTGFTPNADGNNDLLMVHGSLGTVINHFVVYDKWGAVVHESENFDVNSLEGGWDGMVRGKEALPDTYLWKVEATFIDGITEIYTGNTTLIR